MLQVFSICTNITISSKQVLSKAIYSPFKDSLQYYTWAICQACKMNENIAL